jgi:hypothetical protein
VDGQAVTGSHRFTPVQEREFRKAAQIGDVIIELSKRGGQDLLRPIDPAFGRRVNDQYDHTPAYEGLSPRTGRGRVMDLELTSKRAIVTGGRRDIGRAIAALPPKGRRL